MSFIDYHVYSTGDGYAVYINYMATRPDLQKKGFARKLLQAFMGRAEEQGVVYVNFGRVMSPAVWKLYQEYRSRYEKSASRVAVSAKMDF